jgi:hypothetical protein
VEILEVQHLREQLVYAASVGPYASGEVKNRSTLQAKLGMVPETAQATWTLGSITFWKITRCYLAAQIAVPCPGYFADPVVKNSCAGYFRHLTTY